MNKEGLRALLSIADKQNWNGKPVVEIIATLQFSDIDDLFYITSSEGLQYQLDIDEEGEDMMDELAWYSYARMMGWE